MERTVHLVSLGCAKNRVDTEILLGVSEESGLRFVADPAEAEVIVVNTCGFIAPAKRESIDAILEMARWKDAGACCTLVVAGCLVQRYAAELAREIPEVDHFLGSSDMLSLGAILRGEGERMMVGRPEDYTMRATDPRRLSQRAHSAYVKISEGCDRRCSFCAIPAIRGRHRSRAPDDVRREVERLAAAGVVEVNLVGQDTVAYGRDLAGRPTLARLLAAVGDVPGIRWVRLHYLYPERLSDELLEVLAGHPRVLPYVDMPLQHASDAVLRRMRRGHGGRRVRETIERLRGAVPDLVLRTAFLVGHPGETDADFEELLGLVRWAAFDHLGVFVYSPEEGTPAAAMAAPVPARVARARRRRLLEVQRRISRAKLEARVGEEIEVLVDGVDAESDLLLEGRWWGQAPEVDGVVHLANGTARPGEFRRAYVTAASDYELVADLLDASGRRHSPLLESA